MSERRGECQVCKAPSTKICKNCKKVYYCSEDHQREDWYSGHKTQCKKLQQSAISNNNNSNNNIHSNLDNLPSAAPRSISNNNNPNLENRNASQFSQMQSPPNQRVDTSLISNAGYSNNNNNNINNNTNNNNNNNNAVNPAGSNSNNNNNTANNLGKNQLTSQNSMNIGGNNPPTSRSQNNQIQQDNQTNQINNNINNIQQNNILNSPMNTAIQSQTSQNNAIGLNAGGFMNQIDSTSSSNQLRNKEREKSDAVNLDLNRLIMERMKLRSEVVHYLAKFQYNDAIIPAQNLCLKSEQIYDKQKKLSELYELLADQLLEVKIIIKTKTTNDNKLAISKLHDIFHKIKTRIDDNALKNLQQQTLLNDGPNKGKNDIEMKNQVMSEIRKRCNLISLVANLFYSLGYHKDCEEAYVRYVKLIENVFGQDALETSNCYFLMGVYYLQHRYYVKALACFKRSMSIRSQKLTEKHESVTDCMYNIGIAYKQMGKKQKAYVYLEKTLYLRRQVIGESSLPVAQTLEILGKVYIEVNDYKIALNKFQECYSIRKSIIQNNKHPDMVRISLLIVHLFNLIKSQIQIQEATQSKQAQVLKELDLEMQKTTIDSNIQNYIQTQKNAPDRFQELQNQSGIQNMDIQTGSAPNASNPNFNKIPNMMMNSSNAITDNNADEYMKNQQNGNNVNLQSSNHSGGSGQSQQNPNNPNSFVGNQIRFKDQSYNYNRASIMLQRDRAGSQQSKDSASPHKNTLESEDYSPIKKSNYSQKNVDKYQKRKVKEEISEDEDFSENDEMMDRGVGSGGGQKKFTLKVKPSLFARLTHQQMGELLKLNEKINEERKKDPSFNPRDLVINSLFIESVREVKEFCQNLIEDNPEIFKTDDLEDIRYLGGGGISANNGNGFLNIGQSPFEKRMNQQQQYNQSSSFQFQQQQQQQPDFYQQPTFGTSNNNNNNPTINFNNNNNNFNNNNNNNNNNFSNNNISNNVEVTPNYSFPQQNIKNVQFSRGGNEQLTDMRFDPNMDFEAILQGTSNQNDNRQGNYGLSVNQYGNNNINSQSDFISPSSFNNQQNMPQSFKNIDNSSKISKQNDDTSIKKSQVQIEERMSNFNQSKQALAGLDFSKMQNGNKQN